MIVPPKILLTSRDEFISLSKKVNRKKIIFSLLRGSINLLIMGISLVLTFNPQLSLSSTTIGILGGLTGFLKSVDLVTTLSSSINSLFILKSKLRTMIMILTEKIEEWKTYFDGITPEMAISTQIPQELSTKKLFDTISAFYKEIDDSELSELTGGSYNRILANNQDDTPQN